jgi:hypothetical protein
MASGYAAAAEPQPAPANPAASTPETVAEVQPAIDAAPANPRTKLNLHIFGLAYHPDRQGTRTSHLDNELNLGVGLNRELHNNAAGVTSLEAGVFKDSGRNMAKFAGIGYQFKLGQRWSVGADVLAIQSRTYNFGRSFVAPIPRATYDFGPVTLNAVYIPKFQQFNLFAVFGFYLTIPLERW